MKRLLKRITAPEFQEIINVALTSDLGELKRIVQDPTSSAIKVGIATSLVRAIKKGDWKTIDAIIERIVGKVVVKVDHTSAGKRLSAGTTPNVHLYVPANGKTKNEVAS